jgi:hypothetical protein
VEVSQVGQLLIMLVLGVNDLIHHLVINIRPLF